MDRKPLKLKKNEIYIPWYGKSNQTEDVVVVVDRHINRGRRI